MRAATERTDASASTSGRRHTAAAQRGSGTTCTAIKQGSSQWQVASGPVKGQLELRQLAQPGTSGQQHHHRTLERTVNSSQQQSTQRSHSQGSDEALVYHDISSREHRPRDSGHRDRLLTQDIKACRSWQQLQALLHDNARHMNPIHVSAMITQLPKTQPPSLAARARAASPTNNASNLAGCSGLGGVSSRSEQAAFDRFLGQLSNLVLTRCDDLDARGLANVMWAVAQLGYQPSPDLLNRLLFMAYVKLDEFKPQELSNLAWALATMEVQPSAPWMSRYVDQLQARLHTLNPQELAIAAWALARLDLPRTLPGILTVEAGLLPAFCSAGLQLLGSFRSRELLILLSALHQLFDACDKATKGHAPTGMVPSQPPSRSAPAATDEQAVEAAAGSAAAATHPSSKAVESPGSAWPAAQGGAGADAAMPGLQGVALPWQACGSAVRLLHAACARLLDRAGDLSPKDVSTWLFLLAKLQYSPDARCCSHPHPQHRSNDAGRCNPRKDVLQRASATAYTDDVADCANSIVPFTRSAGCKPVTPLEAGSMSHRQAGSQATASAALRPTRACNGMAQAGQTALSNGCSGSRSATQQLEWQQSTRSNATQSMLSAAPRALLLGKASAAQIRHQFYSTLLVRCASDLERFPARSLCCTAWALARLGLHPPAAWVQQLLLHAAARMPSMNASDLCTLGQALYRMRCHPSTTWLQRYLQYTAVQLPACSAAQLSCLARVVGGLGAVPGPAWVAALCKAAQTRVRRMSGLDAALLLRGLARAVTALAEAGEGDAGAAAAAAAARRVVPQALVQQALAAVLRAPTPTPNTSSPAPQDGHDSNSHTAQRTLALVMASIAIDALVPQASARQVLPPLLPVSTPSNVAWPPLLPVPGSQSALAPGARPSTVPLLKRVGVASSPPGRLAGGGLGEASPLNTRSLGALQQELHLLLADQGSRIEPGHVLVLLQSWARVSRDADAAARAPMAASMGMAAGTVSVAVGPAAGVVASSPAGVPVPTVAAVSAGPNKVHAGLQPAHHRVPPHVLGRLVQRLHGSLQHMSAGELSRALYCLARLRFRPPELFLEAATRQLVARLLAGVWGTGNAGLQDAGRNGGKGLGGLASAAATRGKFSSLPAPRETLQLVALAVWALRTLRFPVPRSLAQALARCVALCVGDDSKAAARSRIAHAKQVLSPGSGTQDPKHPKPPRSAASTLSQRQVAPGHAALATRTLCRLGLRPGGALRTRLVAALVRRPANIPLDVLLSLLYTLVVEARALLFPRGWRRLFTRGVLPRLGSVSAPQLQVLVRCLCADRFRYTCPRAVHSALLARCQELKPSLAAPLQHTPPQDSAACRESVPQHPRPSGTSQQLAAVALSQTPAGPLLRLGGTLSGLKWWHLEQDLELLRPRLTVKKHKAASAHFCGWRRRQAASGAAVDTDDK